MKDQSQNQQLFRPNGLPMSASCLATPAVPPFDSRRLRNALGKFPTGVAVVTTCAADGSNVGLTINSFSSVSLDPALVLWSIAKQSSNAEHFVNAGHFAIHVLTSGQRWLAERFASRTVDRFKEVHHTFGENGSPLLPGCAARFECRTVQIVDGGDHHILIGQATALNDCDTAVEPLVFHGGSFTELQSRCIA